MPYAIRKLRNTNFYSVKNLVTGKVHSFGTTLAKAQRQVRALQFLDAYPIVKRVPHRKMV